jgi:hypothetical protein
MLQCKTAEYKCLPNDCVQLHEHSGCAPPKSHYIVGLRSRGQSTEGPTPSRRPPIQGHWATGPICKLNLYIVGRGTMGGLVPGKSLSLEQPSRWAANMPRASSYLRSIQCPPHPPLQRAERSAVARWDRQLALMCFIFPLLAGRPNNREGLSAANPSSMRIGIKIRAWLSRCPIASRGRCRDRERQGHVSWLTRVDAGLVPTNHSRSSSHEQREVTAKSYRAFRHGHHETAATTPRADGADGRCVPRRDGDSLRACEFA